MVPLVGEADAKIALLGTKNGGKQHIHDTIRQPLLSQQSPVASDLHLSVQEGLMKEQQQQSTRQMTTRYYQRIDA